MGDAVMDPIAKAIEGAGFEIIATRLFNERGEQFRAVFAEAECARRRPSERAPPSEARWFGTSASVGDRSQLT
jgi:hypothetical protein